MCLGVPGRVVRWLERDPLLGAAEVDFGGVRKACQMACVPEAKEGEYVLVHAGVALATIDAVAAADLLRTLADLGETDFEISEPVESDPRAADSEGAGP